MEAQKKRQEDQRKKLEERKETSKYKVGDEVPYWNYRVTKPIYEINSWGRKVKMRYEEERSYYAAQGTVTNILIDGYTINQWTHIPDGNICESLEEAKKIAEQHGKSYKEHCEFAQRCR